MLTGSAHRILICAAIAVCAATVPGAREDLRLTAEAAGQSRLARAAAEAKKRGETKVTITSYSDEDGSQLDLETILRTFSVQIVRPLRPQAVTTVDGEFVYTWTLARRIRQLIDRAPLSGTCRLSPPPSLRARGNGGLLIPIYGGTYVFEGVEITDRSQHSPAVFRKDRDYVVIGVRCPRNVTIPAHGALSFFEVADDGRLSVSHTTDRLFIRTMLALGTLKELERYITALKH